MLPLLFVFAALVIYAVVAFYILIFGAISAILVLSSSLRRRTKLMGVLAILVAVVVASHNIAPIAAFLFAPPKWFQWLTWAVALPVNGMLYCAELVHEWFILPSIRFIESVLTQ
jgi:hypothetical protein